MRVNICITLFLITLPLYLTAQISNDNYANATLIQLEPIGFGNQINGNLLFSTPSFTTGNSCGDAYNNDLWYKFVAVSELLKLSYLASQYYIIYQIENGNPKQISCNQQITNVIPGQTYYLRVLQNGTINTFNFTLEYDPQTYEVNDDCANAIPAVVGIGSCGPTYSFNQDSLTASIPPSTCNPTAKDIWYTVIAPPSGTIEISEISGNIVYATVFNADCNALVQQFCDVISNSTPYIVNLTPSQTYLIRMTSGPGISEFCLKDGPTTYPNNDCATSSTLNITAVCSDTINLNLALASLNYDNGCNELDRDVWYNFIAPSTGNIRIDNTGSFNFYCSLYEGNCGALTSLACKVNNSSFLYFTNLVPGNSYQLRISQSSIPTNAISFCYQSVANPSNNECVGAIPLSVYSGTCTTEETLDFSGATNSGFANPCFSDITADLWYTFIPGGPSITFNALPGNKTIYSGSCGSLTPITCVNGSSLNGLTSGQTYYLQLSSYSNVPLDFCLLENSPPSESNQECSSALPVSDGSLITVNTASAAFETTNSTTCTLNPHDLWYAFTSPTNEYVKIKDNNGSNMEFVLYEGSCGSLIELGCFSFNSVDQFIFNNLNPNVAHYLQFYNDLHSITEQKTFTIDFYTPVANDECANASALTAGQGCTNQNIDFKNTTLSNVALPSCVENVNLNWSDLWFDINAGYTGDFAFTNKSSSSLEFDKIYGALYNLDCNALVEVDCAFSLDYNETHIFSGLNPNGHYLLRILTPDKKSGKFCVYISSPITYAENDNCIGALPLTTGEGQCIGNTDISFLNASASGNAFSCSSFAPLSAKDLWYEMETDGAGDYLFNMFKGNTINITLYSGSCGNLTEVYCNDLTGYENYLFESLSPNTIYYLRISSLLSSSFSFCINRVIQESIESMCSSAITILESVDQTCSNSVSGSTISASESNGQFCGSVEAEAVFYSFTPSQSSYYSMVLSNAAANHNISLFGDCTLSSPLACAQDQIAPLLTANQLYIVAVFPSTAGLSSTFNLCIYLSPNLATENVGISIVNPQTKLDVNGGIKPGNSNVTLAGNIRWAGDLEVYNGSEWKSLVEWDHDATQNIDMHGLRIRNLNNPILDTDAANKSYVDAHNDADSNPSNEIQTLSKSGNTISLSNGGSVTDNNTTYSGSDFVVSNQVCPAGQIVIGFTASGNVICGVDAVDDADNDPLNEDDSADGTTISGDGITSPFSVIQTAITPSWSNIQNIPSGFSDDLDNVDDADNNPTNEIQTITKVNGVVTLSNGGGTFNDDVNDADNNPTNEIQTITKVNGVVTLSNGGGTFNDDVNDADNNPSNEIQTITKVNGVVTLSDGGGTFNDDVNDADNNPMNELITEISRSGTNLTITEAGANFSISLDTFSNTFINDNGTVEYPASTIHDFVFGHSQLPPNSVLTQKLFFFDESKAAFRAGQLVSSNKWGSNLMGLASFASGSNSEASGDYSVAFGSTTKASGNYSSALGSTTTASGSYSMAVGNLSTASGSTSFAAGSQASATQTAAISLGIQTTASGLYSMAVGRNVKAESTNTFALGRFNVGGGNPSIWTGTDPLFEVGNGADASNLNNALTILKNGNVGIGQTVPGNLLHVQGNSDSTEPQLNLTETQSGDGARLTFTNTNSVNRWTVYGLVDNTDANSEFNIFHPNTGNILRIKGNGDVGLGGSPNVNLHVFHGNNAGGDGFKIENTVGGNWIRHYVSSGSGDLLLYSTLHGNTSIGNFNDDTGAYSSTSDKRLKKNFEDLHFDWSSLMNLQALTYQYKAGSDDRRYIGMLAQEVKEIYPEMVTYIDDEDVYHMDYSGFGVIAIKAIQELKKENDEQAELIEMQKQRLLEFDKKFEALEAKLKAILER